MLSRWAALSDCWLTDWLYPSFLTGLPLDTRKGENADWPAASVTWGRRWIFTGALRVGVTSTRAVGRLVGQKVSIVRWERSSYCSQSFGRWRCDLFHIELTSNDVLLAPGSASIPTPLSVCISPTPTRDASHSLYRADAAISGPHLLTGWRAADSMQRRRSIVDQAGLELDWRLRVSWTPGAGHRVVEDWLVDLLCLYVVVSRCQLVSASRALSLWRRVMIAVKCQVMTYDEDLTRSKSITAKWCL